MQKDYYSVLGVSRNASSDEIKKAYRHLAHQHHPDKEGGNEERFKEINEAYYVLSDRQRRERYDHFGAGPGSAKTSARGAEGFPGFTEGFESWFADIMEEFFGGAVGAGRARGRDIAADVTVTFEEVLSGARRELSVTRWLACDRCRGSGGEPGSSLKTCAACSGAGRLHRVEQTFFGAMTRLVRCPTCRGAGEAPETPCTTCRGAGRVRRQDRVPVALPSGMESGDTFVVEGGGDAPERPDSGRAGSLYVSVQVEPHPRFRREGDDLWIDEEVSFFTLVRGGSITVRGLDGKAKRLVIPAATPSGKVFRVAGQGLPRRRRSLRGSRGDLYVTVHARVPQKPSARMRSRLEEIADEL